MTDEAVLTGSDGVLAAEKVSAPYKLSPVDCASADVLQSSCFGRSWTYACCSDNNPTTDDSDSQPTDWRDPTRLELNRRSSS